MLKFMLFLIGFGFSVIGFSYIITYLNYLTIGYTWKEYFELIISKPECLLSIFGIILISFTIFTRRDKSDLYL